MLQEGMVVIRRAGVIPGTTAVAIPGGAGRVTVAEADGWRGVNDQ